MYVFAIINENFRLLDWEERPDIVRQKHEKVVVIKNIFSLNDMNVRYLFSCLIFQINLSDMIVFKI